ncbi:BTB/POZ domain-containing protein [Wolffia australiana]
MALLKKGGRGKREEGKRSLPEQTLLLTQRLHHALTLGIKFSADRKRKWHCKDAEITNHALRSISAFLPCVSSHRHPLIKEAVTDVLLAMEGILQSEHATILPAAAEATARLFLNLGNSVREHEVLNLVLPLSKLLSLNQPSVSVSSAVALRCIISSLGLHRESTKSTVIWDAIRETGVVEVLLLQMRDCPVDHFNELVSLLTQIFQRWPASRYPAWQVIVSMPLPLTFSRDRGNVVQLFSALALCADVAMLMLEREEIISGIVSCLRSQLSASMRVQALALARNLSRSEKGCSLLMSRSCEPLVSGIMDAAGSVQGQLITAGCQAVEKSTRWPGPHQACFWKLRVDRVLHCLLFCVDFHQRSTADPLTSPDELRAAVYEKTPANTRIWTWNILGFLSKHVEDDSHLPKAGPQECHLDVLIRCTCFVASDLMFMAPSSKYYHTMTTSELDSVTRAVVLMAYSPSSYISSKAREALSEYIPNSEGSYLMRLVSKLRQRYVDLSHMRVDIGRLALLSCLAQMRGFILERETVDTLAFIIHGCINCEFKVDRPSSGSPRPCCWTNSKDPVSVDYVLVYALQALSQLLPCIDFSLTSEQGFFSVLKKIAGGAGVDPDARWYAASCLGLCFGFYGFPNELGGRMKEFMDAEELTDLQLVFPSGECLRVHGAILAARCPVLVPWEKLTSKGKSGSYESGDGQSIPLSKHVNRGALQKLLEFAYTGCCLVDADVAGPLSLLAKRCNLEFLHDMLKRKLPRCGRQVPYCDFSVLLEKDTHPFSDIILEAKEDEGTWNCRSCSTSLPHVHAHKIVLISSSTYMRALFQSGMRESYAQTVKVPITQKALCKLVSWFYSGELSKLEFHCGWNHMSSTQQFLELLVYLELSWLAESWCLDDVQEQSDDLVILCIETTPSFPINIIEAAYATGRHAVVGTAVGRLGPLYPQLRDSGELDGFDEAIIGMLQSEYIHHSQVTHANTPL